VAARSRFVRRRSDVSVGHFLVGLSASIPEADLACERATRGGAVRDGLAEGEVTASRGFCATRFAGRMGRSTATGASWKTVGCPAVGQCSGMYPLAAVGALHGVCGLAGVGIGAGLDGHEKSVGCMC
jgi:hypothetical protein